MNNTPPRLQEPASDHGATRHQSTMNRIHSHLHTIASCCGLSCQPRASSHAPSTLPKQQHSLGIRKSLQRGLPKRTPQNGAGKEKWSRLETLPKQHWWSALDPLCPKIGRSLSKRVLSFLFSPGSLTRGSEPKTQSTATKHWPLGNRSYYKFKCRDLKTLTHCLTNTILPSESLKA